VAGEEVAFFRGGFEVGCGRSGVGVEDSEVEGRGREGREGLEGGVL